MNLCVYHHVFASRAQASAFAAQERKRFPADLYGTDLTVAPRVDRPMASLVAGEAPEHLQERNGGAHQWVVDGSRTHTPRVS